MPIEWTDELNDLYVKMLFAQQMDLVPKSRQIMRELAACQANCFRRVLAFDQNLNMAQTDAELLQGGLTELLLGGMGNHDGIFP